MSAELVLFGVASEGKVEQWDGLNTPAGILLRWFHSRDLGFPDYGYDVWRSTVPDIPALSWYLIAPAITGLTNYDYAGEIWIESQLGFDFVGSGPDTALVINPEDRISLNFPDPAWFLNLQASRLLPGTIMAKLFSGGAIRETRVLSSGDPPWIWRTRGVDRVELTGEGALGVVRYGLINSSRRWSHLAHICLPITDPAYPCTPQSTGTDEDEAMSRVPAGVDWNARYSAGFKQLHPYLKALATRAPVPTFPPSTQLNAPTMGLDPESAILLAALDPHIARVVGLAWDDTTIQLDGQEWTYKISGRWKGSPISVALASIEQVLSLGRVGIRFTTDFEAAEEVDGAVLLRSSRKKPVRIEFEEAKKELGLEFVGEDDVRWRAYGESGDLIADGVFDGTDFREIEEGQALGKNVNRIEADGIRAVELVSSAPIAMFSIGVAGPPVERFAILPSIFATDTGPPQGPTWINSWTEQPAGTAGPLQAGLTWELQASPSGVYTENACVLHQLAGNQLSTDPSDPEPQPPPFDSSDLLNGGKPILVPSETAAAQQPPARYYTDEKLVEGWRCWWARSIDLFGRVSDPSPATIEMLEDAAIPPPPPLLLTEYVQADLPPQQAALLGRSVLAREWSATYPSADGVVVVWGWTPELEKQAPDVDAFRVFVRRPTLAVNPGPGDPEESYAGVSWGTMRSEVGPIPVRLDGQITAASSVIPSIAITSVSQVDATHAACSSDLSLESGGGALIGASLRSGSSTYEIVGHGEGSTVTLTVEHQANAAPTPGTYEIDASTVDILNVDTDLTPPSLAGTQIRRRTGGALVVGAQRLMVIGREGGTFVCRRVPGGPALASGNSVSWYPAYAVVIEDTGFGPLASATQPVAHAQVTVRSVRRYATRPLESSDGTPGILTAVDASPPATPGPVDPIPTGRYCAEIGTRADWYGVSRITLNWTPQPGLGYVVYRAMGDAIFQLDLKAHRDGSTVTPHNFPQSVWPTDMWSDSNRKQIVQTDLTALDAAIAGGDEQQIEAAYEGLHADAQQLIAGQSAVESAYVALQGSALTSSDVPFTDEVDGRSRVHWFYRIACRSQAGLESGKSPPTPPICCPDVVPPAVPLVQQALADDNKVRLQWQMSPERDLARYIIYRTDDAAKAADVREMQLVARVAPTPTSTLGPNETAPTAVSGRAWLEHADPAPGGKDWLYRIVAEDTAGNASEASAVLKGRSLVPPPAPPVWNPPVRGTSSISLSWTHPSNQRLSCLVERRPNGGALWSAISDWLPRGTYALEDQVTDLSAAWEYRIRVRDQLGQVAASMPIVSLPKVP